MHIACLAILDNGNTMRHIARGLRDYCNQTATAYHQTKDAFCHIPDASVIQWDGNLDTDDYDFFITNDLTYFHYHEQLKDKPRLVKCNGFWAKNNAPWIHHDHLKHGTTYVSSPCDWTLASVLPFSIQTLPPMIDMRLLPKPNFPENLRIGHAGSNIAKGTHTIIKALQPYRKQGIEIDIIQNTPWKQCIERKAQCHIFIDNANQPSFGVNTIESLALGSLVLNKPLHPYTFQHFNCSIPYYPFPTGINEVIKVAKATQEGFPLYPHRQEWAIDHFDLSTQSWKWLRWIEFVLHGVTPVTGS